jgi:hypothetical protein
LKVLVSKAQLLFSNSADGVVTGTGKYEHLIVSAQEIAASVAQLYVSSRVKADRDSKRMAELGVASKSVNTCTASVVATVKSGQQTLSDESKGKHENISQWRNYGEGSRRKPSLIRPEGPKIF